jgi:hypothetical protein
VTSTTFGWCWVSFSLPWPRPEERSCESIRFSLRAVPGNYLPSFLRWTRVRRSSLRCFFFDMRLRRFLMTEPMNSAT